MAHAYIESTYLLYFKVFIHFHEKKSQYLLVRCLQLPSCLAVTRTVEASPFDMSHLGTIVDANFILHAKSLSVVEL